jgi:hypothetical protein
MSAKEGRKKVSLPPLYMPERPHTTSDSEKENMTAVAAQPICTMAGSPCGRFFGWVFSGGFFFAGCCCFWWVFVCVLERAGCMRVIGVGVTETGRRTRAGSVASSFWGGADADRSAAANRVRDERRRRPSLPLSSPPPPSTLCQNDEPSVRPDRSAPSRVAYGSAPARRTADLRRQAGHCRPGARVCRERKRERRRAQKLPAQPKKSKRGTHVGDHERLLGGLGGRGDRQGQGRAEAGGHGHLCFDDG